jgi:hypothetical protein
VLAVDEVGLDDVAIEVVDHLDAGGSDLVGDRAERG